jgi:YlmC/YmxH family sporulation protein
MIKAAQKAALFFIKVLLKQKNHIFSITHFSGGGVAMVKISEFQIKDVVNISDGKKLGNIGDIDINLTTGKIEAIVIARSSRVLGLFGKDEDIVLPWRNILKIGEDVILVRYSTAESTSSDQVNE